MLRVIALGSTASLPTKASLPSSFAVKYGGTFLFDACEAVQQQLMKFGGGGKIEAIFISHLHADHVLGVFGLIQSMNLGQRTAPLLITGPVGSKEFFSSIFKIKEFAPQFPVELKEAGKRSVVFESRLFTVTAFPVSHGTKAVGYVLETPSYRRFDESKAKKAGIRGHLFSLIQEKGQVLVNKKRVKYEDVTYLQAGRKIVYSGDTLPCPSLRKEARNADLLIHESTFSDEDEALAKEKKHSTVGQAANLAKSAKVKKLLLTHFSNRYEDRAPLLDSAQKIFPEAQLASDGLEIDV